VEFPPLKRSGMAGNITRGLSTPAVKCPLQVFSTSWGFTPGPCRRQVCFTLPSLLGFRLPGACASGAAHLSVSISCPLVVTSRLSSLLRNGRQPGRPPSGPCSPFAPGCLSSTAEAQNSRPSSRPLDCSPPQSYIASGSTPDFRRRYPPALQNSDSVAAEAVSVSLSLCLRVLSRPRNAHLSRDMRLSQGSRPRNNSCALKDIQVQAY